MTVGFAHYAPGAANEWVVTYDEALIITRGAFTVTSADGVETTARVAEIIFLRAGTPVVYSAKGDGAELVYVTYPHWSETEASERFLDVFQPSEDRPEQQDAEAVLRTSTTRSSAASPSTSSPSTTRLTRTSCSRPPWGRPAASRR